MHQYLCPWSKVIAHAQTVLDSESPLTTSVAHLREKLFNCEGEAIFSLQEQAQNS